MSIGAVLGNDIHARRRTDIQRDEGGEFPDAATTHAGALVRRRRHTHRVRRAGRQIS